MLYKNLHEAIAAMDAQAVSRMIAEGADVNAADADGFKPLQLACLVGTHESIFYTMKYPASASLGTKHPREQWPARRMELTRLLLQAGADPNAPGLDPWGKTFNLIFRAHTMDPAVADLMAEYDAAEHNPSLTSARIALKADATPVSVLGDDLRIPYLDVSALAFSELDTLVLQRLRHWSDDEIAWSAIKYTAGQRAVTAALLVEGSVDNGGFASCLYDLPWEVLDSAEEAFRLLGAPRRAAVVAKVIAALPWRERGQTSEQRESLIEEHLPAKAQRAIEKLDDAFFACEDEEIEELITQYILRNPEAFFRGNPGG